MSQKTDECVECNEAKRTADVRAAATTDQQSGLQLGECGPVYKEWVTCIENSGGQVTKCTDVMKRFRSCHANLGKQAPQ